MIALKSFKGGGSAKSMVDFSGFLGLLELTIWVEKVVLLFAPLVCISTLSTNTTATYWWLSDYGSPRNGPSTWVKDLTVVSHLHC